MRQDDQKSQRAEVWWGVMGEEKQTITCVVIASPEAKTACGGGIAHMPNRRAWHKKAGKTSTVEAHAEIDIFKIEIVPFVKETDFLQGGGPEE